MLPVATLAAVVIVASIGLVSPAEFRAVHSIRTIEYHWALVAAFGVIALGTLKGLLVAVLVSVFSLVVRANAHSIHVLGRKPRTNRPLSPENPEDETYHGLLLLRPEGAIFFANAPRLGQKIRELVAEFKPRVLVLDLSAVPDMEYTAVMMLADGEEMAREDGAAMSLVAMNPAVQEIIRRMPLWGRLEGERIYPYPRSGGGVVWAAVGGRSDAEELSGRSNGQRTRVSSPRNPRHSYRLDPRQAHQVREVTLHRPKHEACSEMC